MKKRIIIDDIPQYQEGGGWESGMMRGKIAIADAMGNPAAHRMVQNYPQTYTFNGTEDGSRVPAGATGTHYMSSMDNYAVPFIQQDKSGKLQYNKNARPTDREAIRFNTPTDAQYFAEHYKEVAPMMRNSEQYRYGGNAKNAAGWKKQYGGYTDEYANGGMIKRADGSYSKRGLWDNIRANAGSGKEPTREMLEQERKIKANQKMYGGPTRYDIGGVTEENPMGGATMFTGQNPAGTSTTVATETTYDPATDPNNPVNQNIPMPQQGGYAAAQGAAYDTTGITDSQPDQAAPPTGPKQPRQPFGTGYRNLLGAAMMYGQYAADRRQQKGLKAYGIQQGMTQMNPVATGMNKGQYNQQGQLQQQFSAPGRFGRYGGSMQPEYAIGGEYEMDDATIEALSRKGYKIKYM